MAFGSIGGSVGKIVSINSISKVVNPSLLTPKLTTGLIPSSNSLAALVATALKTTTVLTPAQIAAGQALLGKK